MSEKNKKDTISMEEFNLYKINQDIRFRKSIEKTSDQLHKKFQQDMEITKEEGLTIIKKLQTELKRMHEVESDWISKYNKHVHYTNMNLSQKDNLINQKEMIILTLKIELSKRSKWWRKHD